MLSKTFLSAVLVALCIGASLAAIIPTEPTTTAAPECTVEEIGEGLEEKQCGDLSTLRFSANKSVICTERELFENEELSVLELDNDETACYVINRDEFPNGIDYTQADKDELAEEADVELAKIIRGFVPKCQGRTIFKMRGETNADAQGGRTKRQTRRCYRCIRIIYRLRTTGRIVRIRIFCFRRPCA